MILGLYVQRIADIILQRCGNFVFNFAYYKTETSRFISSRSRDCTSFCLVICCLLQNLCFRLNSTERALLGVVTEYAVTRPLCLNLLNNAVVNFYHSSLYFNSTSPWRKCLVTPTAGVSSQRSLHVGFVVDETESRSGPGFDPRSGCFLGEVFFGFFPHLYDKCREALGPQDPRI